VPCTEKVRGQELDRGDPYWNAELQQLCQQVTYQLVDAYTGELCGEETVEECEGYVPCTEKVRGQELGRGDPYWDTELQQLCQQVTYQLVDAYTGEACGEETVEECQPYVPCTEKVRGQELGRGDPYWDTELQQLCQQVTYQLVDAYTGEPCGEETVEECEGYVPCTEKVRGQELGRGDPYWDTELQQLCQQVTYQLVDAYTGEPCGEETVEECEGYEPCAETVRGDEVSRGKPYWSDERQLVCEEVTYERLDAYTGALCGTETVEECDGYVLCTETSAWKDTYSAWAWDTARWDMCRDVTLTQYDRYDRSYVCDQLRERECMGQQLPRPNPGSCPLCLEGVLFQSDRNGNWEIYRGDGCDATRLTYNQASDTAPQWNTTRLYVVFQSNRDSNWEIYTMDGSGNNQLNLTKHAAADMAPSWSCSHIYFQSDRDGNWEIYRMNGDGSGQTRLTNNLVPDAQPAASCATGKVAYQSLRDGDWELCTMNLDGTGVQCITNTPWDEVSPTWSPSGDRIAFQTNEGGTWRIAVLDVATGAKSFITRGTGDSAESPAWYYTDCEWIYFQGLSLGDWDVYRVKPDASVSERAIYFPGARDMLDDQVILP
jgi:TolB protein